MSQLSQTFEGRFDLISRLGEGAHGEVFEALDRMRGIRVALKGLRDNSPQSILRFKREFRALAQMHHPNLVEFGELFEHAGRWFFSMELVEGVDFVRYVREDAASGMLLPPTEALREAEIARLSHALVQLGRGLHALHSSGKIHRDIKPSNLLIRRDGRLVVLDFGLVTPSRSELMSATEQVVGTIGYMAPEQADARALTPAADCYPVGVLIYEVLTGELPFAGPPLDVLRAKLSRPVTIPHERAALLPAALVSLCHDLCRVDPSARPSAQELIARAADLLPAARTARQVREPDRSAVSIACFGRDRELARLDEAFERVRSGSLTQVRIFGASGLGKTTLLRAFRERLAERTNACVLSGSCNEQERVAYKAFDAAIDELGRKLERLNREQCARLAPKHAGALASVFPVLGRLAEAADTTSQRLPPDPITLRSRAYAALRDLLHRLAERAPLVLILDDLQWSDTESLELLRALLRLPDPPPLLLIAALRPLDECPPEQRAHIERAFRSANCLDLEIGVLPAVAATQLAQHLTHVDEPTAQRIATAAACHPLFIELLARTTQRERGEVFELAEALRLDMEALSPAAHRILQLLAVAGASVPERALADAAGLEAHALGEALSELRHGRFARVFESAGEFSVAPFHAKLCPAVLAHIDEATLRQHHLALARALTRATGRDPEALAIHWLHAGRADEAAVWFSQAAVLAERSQAFGHAADLYRSALDAGTETSASERPRWQQHRAAALANAGRNDEAAEAFLSAAEGCEYALSRDLQRRAAEQFLFAGMTERGLSIARTLLADIGESLAQNAALALSSLSWRRLRVSMHGNEIRERPAERASDDERYACDLLWSICVPLSSLDLVRSLDLHSRCLMRAFRLGDPARIARSLAFEGLYMRSDSAEAELRVRGVLATAEKLARQAKDPYLQAFSRLCHSTFYLLIGEPSLALSNADAAALQLGDECRNVAWEIGVARVTALSAAAYVGRFRELEQRLQAATEEAEARGNFHAFATFVTVNRCTVDLAADRPEACRADLHRVELQCPAEWHLQHAFALGAHVLLDLYAGGDSAHERLEEGWQRLRHRLILTSDRFRIFFLFVRGLAALSALLADNCDKRARIKLVRSCARQLARERLVDAIGGAHMLQGQLAAYHGDLDAAAVQYRAAAELWARVGMYGCKIAKLRLGQIVGGDEGAELIASCMQWAREENIVNPEQFFRICGPVVASRPHA